MHGWTEHRDDIYSALPKGGALWYYMYAVSGKKAGCAKKVVRVMDACTARRINFLIFPIIQREENPALFRQYI